MRRIDLTVLLTLLILALSLAACGSRGAQPAAEPTATAAAATAAPTVPGDAESPLPSPTTPTDAESPLPLPTDAGAGTTTQMVTFRDEFAGYEIDYPAGWALFDPEPEIKRDAYIYSTTLMSWQPEEPGTEGIPEGSSKIDIVVSNAAAATLDEAVESFRRDLEQTELPVELISEEAVTFAGGLTGMKFEIETSEGDMVYDFVTSINGHRILLSGRGDPAVLDAIVQTLRALP